MSRLNVDVPVRVLLAYPGVRRLDGQASTLGHGIAGIDGEIEQRTLQLSRIHLRVPQSRTSNELDFDVLSQRAALQVIQAEHQLIDVEG